MKRLLLASLAGAAALAAGADAPFALRVVDAATGRGVPLVEVKGVPDQIHHTVHWFWGDTDRLAHPLGQFNTSGAISKLPRGGGLPPAHGVDLEYFVGEDGFSRPMFKRENGVLIWVHGAFGLEDAGGKLWVLTHYSRRKSLTEELSSGLAMLNDRTNLFEHVLDCPSPNLPAPRGQAFRYRDEGREFVAFATPYPLVRVRADWSVAMDPRHWESFTPLVEGTVWQEGATPRLERGADGRVRWAWKRRTGVVDRGAVQKMLERGELEARDNWLHTVDAADGRAVRLHVGSVKWNEYRRRWILIAHEIGGGPSFLGEVWYAEARRPEGPFPRAVKIVTHDNYSFYNVAQHDFFDEDGGRTIYFEGTYTAAFAKAAVPTPWYDYNQIMYCLDLGDSRLQGAFLD